MTSPQLLNDPRSLLEAIFDIVRDNEASNVLIDRIFDNVPAPVIITQPSFQNRWPKIIYVNRHFCSLYSYSREALRNATTEVISGEKTDLSIVSEMRDEVLSDGISRIPLTTYDSFGREHRIRVDVSRFALDHSPAVDLWIGLHLPID